MESQSNAGYPHASSDLLNCFLLLMGGKRLIKSEESSLKTQQNTCNILLKHLATLLDHVVRELAKCMQHLATSKNVATCCYRVAKLMQHIARNNVTRCCFEMLSVFDWALRI